MTQLREIWFGASVAVPDGIMPKDLELVLMEIVLDPVSYLSGMRRARTLRSRYTVGNDVSQVHARFRVYLMQHAS